MPNKMETCNDISCDTGQGKTDWHYVWWSTMSVLTLDKINLDDNQYGELQYQLTLDKKKNKWQ